MPGTLLILARLLALCSTTLLATTAALAADGWKAVDPLELALKTPVVEKGADAEAIFWDVYLDDIRSGLVLSHYIRIKIFSERGRAQQSKVDIPYSAKFEIKDIAGRTLKPDGSTLELKSEDVFERDIVKLSGVKVKAKSFVLPGIEIGSLIEYRWLEVRPGRFAQYVRLPFQRSIPVQRISYHFKPRPNVAGAMAFRYFNMPVTGLVREADGFFSSTMRNVKAFHEEPMMPPEDQVRSWLLVYYMPEQRLNTEKFWKDLGKRAHDLLKPSMKVSDDVRQAALEAIGEATVADEKLRRLFEYCRSRVKDVYSVTSGMTAQDIANRKENKSPSDTLKRGSGDSKEINLLFAALATAAGFHTRAVLLADRSDIFFDSSFPDGYFMSALDIGVKVDEQWRFFDPGGTYIPHGMLAWQQEGQDGLICDSVEPVFVKTPMSPPEKSKQMRTARLRLSEDGTLEGDVRIEFTGHFAIEKKSLSDDNSQAYLQETLRDQITRQMSTAEVSDIHIENVTDPVKHFVYSYHVRVRGYAQRAAKRLFLQPAFFEYGSKPLFAAGSRIHEIYFHYPWSTEDQVSIELPQEYVADNADTPTAFALDAVSEYKGSISIAKDGKTISLQRHFFFGGGGTIVFPAKKYSLLKDHFDMVHRQDNHTITLKPVAAGSQD